MFHFSLANFAKTQQKYQKIAKIPKLHTYLLTYLLTYILYDLLNQAGYTVEKEKRYDNNNIRITGRPGDLKILNYFVDDDSINADDLYIDITVPNIYADKYIDTAKDHRAKIANNSENNKSTKYENREDIRGLGIETLGAMGNNFKKLIQEIARKISIRTNVKYPLVVNRIRTKIFSSLMKSNIEMIRKSFNISLQI